MSFLLRFNAALIIVWFMYLSYQLNYMTDASFPFYVDVFSLVSLVLLHVFYLVRKPSVYGFSIVLSYVLLMANGLKIMLTLENVITIFGFFSIVLSVLLIVFLIGIRGFLRSEKGRAAFWGEKKTNERSNETKSDTHLDNINPDPKLPESSKS